MGIMADHEISGCQKEERHCKPCEYFRYDKVSRRLKGIKQSCVRTDDKQCCDDPEKVNSGFDGLLFHNRSQTVMISPSVLLPDTSYPTLSGRISSWS